MNAKKRDLNNGLSIDWDWVRHKLLEMERIRPNENTGSKSLILKCAGLSLKKARSLAASRMASVESDIVVIDQQRIKVGGKILLIGRKLLGYIKKASSAHLFLITLGPKLEDTASHLMKKGEFLEGYFLDRIGSLAVESLADSVENDLRNVYARRDLSVSMRFSPGYCDWPIEEQFKLDEILGFSRAGVRLTKSCMMVPKKSISAVVAIGYKELFSKKISQCIICDKKVCDYKRV